MTTMSTIATGLTCIKTGMSMLEMREMPVPEPGPGEAIVKTTLSSVCGSDMHFLHEFPMPRSAQYVAMGHEAAGIVYAVGLGVTNFKPGDRVVASCVFGCGYCVNCQQGDVSACVTLGRIPGITNVLQGCQGEYFRVPYASINMARIPDELSDEQAIFAGDIMSTGFGAIERAGLELGGSVAVFAQGPVGLCATAGARARGAGLIVAVESIPERRQMAEQLGATVIVDPESAVDEIKRLTGGRGVDVAVEALGNLATWQNALAVTRLNGVVSSVGVYAAYKELPVAIGPAFVQRRIVTTLCPGGAARLERLFDAVRYGRVDLTPLFTHHMRIADTLEAYDIFEHRRDGVVKIALTP